MAPHRRLFRRYLLALVLLVGGVLLASGAVQSYFAYTEQRASLERYQLEQAALAAQRIDLWFQAITPSIDAANQVLLNTGATTAQQRTEEYARLMAQVPSITDLRYIDHRGLLLLQRHRLQLNEIGGDEDESSDPAFLLARQRMPYFGPVTFLDGSEPSMTIAVNDLQADPGVTEVDVNLKFILDDISQIKVGHAGTAFVVDGSGHLIAHPDISLVLRASDLSGLPQVRYARRAGAPASAVSTGKDPRDLGAVLSAYTTITPPGWYLFADVPRGEAFAPLQEALLRTVALLLGGLLLAALVSIVLARRMVTPIEALKAGAEQIGRGALDRRIEVCTGDELEALAEEFNRMAAGLQASYAQLEQKVDERTRELSTALAQVDAQRVALEVASRHKSTFLAAMSHELRTPLTAVNGFSEVLLARMYGDLTADQDGMVRDILAAGRHLLALIEDILDLAKVEAGRMELAWAPLSLAEVVEASLVMVREQAAQKELSLSVTIDPALGLITADVRKVTQVVLNLLNNAVKFTPEGGRIDVHVWQRDGTATIAVRDTGIGIAPEEQETIFEQFRQAGAPGEREGTGLGLALAKQFVALHGGSIEVESAPGAGSTFTVTLPLQPPAAVLAMTQSAAEVPV